MCKWFESFVEAAGEQPANGSKKTNKQMKLWNNYQL